MPTRSGHHRCVSKQTIIRNSRCPLLALSGHDVLHCTCPLLTQQTPPKDLVPLCQILYLLGQGPIFCTFGKALKSVYEFNARL